MNTLERFIEYLCGDFNNEEQLAKEKELEKEDFWI